MFAAVPSRFLALALLTCASLVHAQTTPEAAQPAAPFEPRSGQPGKDVVWVPTPQTVVDKMLDLARVGPKDVVIDLGSGDGRTVITAAKRGARASGIEYNPDMVELSRRNAEKEGVAQKATFVKADLFETSFDQATVITMFLLPELNRKLRPKILGLKPGTRIVSNTFTMGEWEPDDTADLIGQPGCDNSYCKALFWVVPKQVAGTYKVKQGTITLEQEFQKLTGTLTRGGSTVPLTGRVRGESIELTVGGKKYRGRMQGRSLQLRDAA